MILPVGHQKLQWPRHGHCRLRPLSRLLVGRGKTMKFAHPPSNAHAWHQSRLCDAVQPRRGVSNNPLIAASVGSLGVLDVSRKRSREATSSLAASTQSFCAVSLFPSRRPIQTKPALTSACGSETNKTAPFVWCRGACGYRCWARCISSSTSN